MDNCEICGMHGVQKGLDWAVQERICGRCGKYKFQAQMGHSWLPPQGEQEIIRYAGWVREQNEADVIPALTPEICRYLKASTAPPIIARSNKLLKALSTLKPRFAHPFSIEETLSNPMLLGISYSIDRDDLQFLISVLEHRGAIAFYPSRVAFKLTPDGALLLEKLKSSGSELIQGFVAMSFAQHLDAAYSEGFYPAIKLAGFAPMRIDAKHYVGGISDQIMSEIRSSRFVIADYTEQNNGVYFEAGFALGLGRVVIPTCRRDQINSLHFDIKHLNTILWDTPSDLKGALAQRITAVVGRGPLPS